MWLNRGRLVVITLAAVIVFARIRVKDKAALLAVLVVISLYGLLFRRLRNRRVGSAAVGSFYDMLDSEKRRAVEVVVDKKAEEQAPEDAEGDGPDAT